MNEIINQIFNKDLNFKNNKDKNTYGYFKYKEIFFFVNVFILIVLTFLNSLSILLIEKTPKVLDYVNSYLLAHFNIFLFIIFIFIFFKKNKFVTSFDKLIYKYVSIIKLIKIHKQAMFGNEVLKIIKEINLRKNDSFEELFYEKILERKMSEIKVIYVLKSNINKYTVKDFYKHLLINISRIEDSWNKNLKETNPINIILLNGNFYFKFEKEVSNFNEEINMVLKNTLMNLNINDMIKYFSSKSREIKMLRNIKEKDTFIVKRKL